MQQQKVSMGKKKFRIGDLAKELKVKKYVVRFWEKEFELKSDRSNGGQRFYSEHDLATFSTIKKLLYDDGFTIAGAKKHLEPKKRPALIKENPIKGKMTEPVQQAAQEEPLSQKPQTQKIAPAQVTESFDQSQAQELKCELERTKEKYESVINQLHDLKELLIDFKEKI